MRTQIVDGYKFIKDDKTGYWQSNQFIKLDGKPKRLHRYIWEKHSGVIPDGYEIHHVDENKDNNDISNLECLSNHDHQSLHGKEHFEKDPEWYKRFTSAGQKAAPAWHSSEAGHEWHKQHYEQTKDVLHKTHEMNCKQCNVRFNGHDNSMFCSSKCKQRWRAAHHIDDVTRHCTICDKEFSTNKYSKAKTCSRHCGAMLRNKNRGGEYHLRSKTTQTS